MSDIGVTNVLSQYCGAPIVGEILSDKCHMLTAQARNMDLKIRYDFLIEVFG